MFRSVWSGHTSCEGQCMRNNSNASHRKTNPDILFPKQRKVVLPTMVWTGTVFKHLTWQVITLAVIVLNTWDRLVVLGNFFFSFLPFPIIISTMKNQSIWNFIKRRTELLISYLLCSKKCTKPTRDWKQTSIFFIRTHT